MIGKHIVLRRWCENDADALFALASEPVVGEMARFPTHKDRAESIRVIREIFCKPESYAVVSSANGTLLGCINVFPRIKGESVYESVEVNIGYWLGMPFWGNGYMTEAVKMLCDRCFHSGLFRCRSIIGFTSEDNIGSRRVMEKSGFHLVEARDGTCHYKISRQLDS